MPVAIHSRTDYPVNEALSAAYTWATAVHGELIGIRDPPSRLKRFSEALPDCYLIIETLQKIHSNVYQFYNPARPHDRFGLLPILKEFIQTCQELHDILEILSRSSVKVLLSGLLCHKGSLEGHTVKALERRLNGHREALISALTQIMQVTISDMRNTSSERDLILSNVLEEMKKWKSPRKRSRLSKVIRPGSSGSEKQDWKPVLGRYFEYINAYPHGQTHQMEKEWEYQRVGGASSHYQHRASSWTSHRSRERPRLSPTPTSGTASSTTIVEDSSSVFNDRLSETSKSSQRTRTPYIPHTPTSFHKRGPSYRSPGFYDTNSFHSLSGLAARRPRSRQSYPKLRDQNPASHQPQRNSRIYNHRVTIATSNPLWDEVITQRTSTMPVRGTKAARRASDRHTIAFNNEPVPGVSWPDPRRCSIRIVSNEDQQDRTPAPAPMPTRAQTVKYASNSRAVGFNTQRSQTGPVYVLNREPIGHVSPAILSQQKSVLHIGKTNSILKQTSPYTNTKAITDIVSVPVENETDLVELQKSLEQILDNLA